MTQSPAHQSVDQPNPFRGAEFDVVVQTVGLAWTSWRIARPSVWNFYCRRGGEASRRDIVPIPQHHPRALTQRDLLFRLCRGGGPIGSHHHRVVVQAIRVLYLVLLALPFAAPRGPGGRWRGACGRRSGRRRALRRGALREGMRRASVAWGRRWRAQWLVRKRGVSGFSTTVLRMLDERSTNERIVRASETDANGRAR
jgi:hypothetical protein